MSVSVRTVKCVNNIPGKERYCCSVFFPVSAASIGESVVARVVSPYEEMGNVEARIVDVSALSVDCSVNTDELVILIGDFSIAVFDTNSSVGTYAGRYRLPLDEGLIDIGDCGGPLVVGQNSFFGVRFNVENVGGDPDNVSGGVVVNFEFGLVGHSLSD